jgi:carboxymethylenebutenolidase
MCFDTDSEPPIPRIAGAAVSHDDLVLTSADGSSFAAFAAVPDGELATGVVIYPDVRGLYHFYEELALRFAERGHGAIAFDYFGRTAGVGKRDDDFEYPPHVDQTTDAGVQADARAAIEELRSRGATRMFSIGFCFGGRASWVGAASGHGLAGAIGFYGSPTRERGGPSVVQRAAQIACPILALQAGDDQSITAADNAAFDQVLTEHGVEHEIVVYDGAPHSFFDRKQEDYAEASDDAWRRTLAFISQHS